VRWVIFFGWLGKGGRSFALGFATEKCKSRGVFSVRVLENTFSWATFVADRWGPLGWVQKSWSFAVGCFVWCFVFAKPRAAGVQKSGTLRFLADDFFAEVGVEIWLSKNLEQDTIVGDCGGGSEEFFWPGGGGRLKKVPDTFFLPFFSPFFSRPLRRALRALATAGCNKSEFSSHCHPSRHGRCADSARRIRWFE